MNPELKRAAELAAEYIDGLDTEPVSHEPSVGDLRATLGRELTTDGVPALQVIEELAVDARDGLLNTASGRFYGWVIGGGIPVAIAADWLTSAWDQNAGAYACSPTAAVIEEVVADWLKEILGLPKQASYAFVTGCQMASVTALAAARHKILTDKDWPVAEQGLSGSPAIRVLVGEHHETLLRALRLLGIGTDSIVQVAINNDGRINVDALERELKQNTDAPTIVALAAGDLNRGAFDPFGEACDVAHECGAWVHVDGAFGLWVASSRKLCHLVNGIEKADSWAMDAHKWLNVPHDSGIAFVADPKSHRAAMTIPAAYKVEVADVRDELEWGPEWSRRARAIPIYAALRALGRNGVAELVERCCDLTKDLVKRLGELPGVEVLTTPIINQGLVRFLDPNGDHDTRTDAVIQYINESGDAWFGGTIWNGMRVMRISLSNWRTNQDDIDRTVAAVRSALNKASN
ncbi:MAG: aminotransferase class V-fold PLP-dependent enzyme [Gammaproteobacteria bacterium]|nr:aminotransferase class V-fold PLP-dependent enzyme [Gammaproteobacteria bacterium]MDH3467844.1 aminotransferase class V-fold PLP-dependent enzyme [Gammaproteobacteria bacterium]